MKNRRFHGAAAGAAVAGDEESKKGNHKRNQKKNEKRLGGRGLSLQAFANAKSGPSGYNPSLIKKQREFYKNAKYVGKFKKSMKRESQHKNLLPTAPMLEDFLVNENETKPSMSKKKKRQNSSLQSVREDFEKKQAEAEKAKLERESMIQAKKAEMAKAIARRKDLKEKMFKKTRSGQPVMKYRIEHLLQGLLPNSAD